MRIVSSLVIFLCLFTAPILAQGIAPNEVKVFEHDDFVGQSLSFSLEPGMRHKLVWSLGDMDDRISSILVGANVEVMVFNHGNFADTWTTFTANKYSIGKQDSIYDDDIDWNDTISSLIVYPKQEKDFVMNIPSDVYGVFMSNEGNLFRSSKIRFFPMPEQTSVTEAKFASFGEDMNDVFDTVLLHKKIEVTLFEDVDFKGKSLYLPGGYLESDKHLFELDDYEFDDISSSLVVGLRGLSSLKVTGTVIPPSKKEEAQIRPNIISRRSGVDTKPTIKVKPGDIQPPILDIGGMWESNIGRIYNIEQTGESFTWTVLSLLQVGKGTITGTTIEASWEGNAGTGSAKGKIILDESGKPIRIEWSNGVVFKRNP